MPSTEALMEMLATMILFVLITMIILQALLVARGDEVSFGHAYPMTQKIVYMINALSASPENESATLKINTAHYRIVFDEENNYVECETDLFGNTKYGLFIFKDVELMAEDIDCITNPTLCIEPKNLIFRKTVLPDGHVRVAIGETEEAPGPCGILPCISAGFCTGEGGSCAGGCGPGKCCCDLP